MPVISRARSTPWLRLRIPRALPKAIATRARTITWEVKAFVEATPISGPAWMYTPASVSLAIVEPTTLTMPNTRQPLDLHTLSAARVSAVSPLWLMTNITVPGSRTVSR